MDKAVGTNKGAATTTSSPATAAPLATAGTALAKLDAKNVKMADAPPANYIRRDTNANSFFRGKKGDVLHGVIVGPAHVGLAGEQYLAGGVTNEAYPKVVTVELLADTVGMAKENETDDTKAAFGVRTGELIYVNVWVRTRALLTKKAGTGIWFKVIDEKKIAGGKTVKIVETSDDEVEASDAAPVGSPALTAGKPS